MFKCKVCLEKDKRIEDLKEQVRMLKDLALPKPTFSTSAFEANQILNGTSDTVELNKDKLKEQEEIQREAAIILSGDY